MAAKKESLTGSTNDLEIVVSRVFDAPLEVVWDAWTDPEKVVHWWGPRGFTTTIHEMDVRPGGRWRHTMRAPDGTQFPNLSVFLEVVKHQRIVYSHSGGREGDPAADFEATWTFEGEGKKTLLTGRMVFPSAEVRNLIVKTYQAIEGANQTFDRLGEQLARTPIVMERTYDAPAALVWKAITDYECMKQWYMPALKSFEPELGFETEFSIHHNGKDFLHFWKVTELIPGRRIVYSWKYDGYPGDSLVRFELFPEGKQTRLRLTHTGIETFLPEKNPELARGNFNDGWTAIVSLLEGYLQKSVTTEIARELVLSRLLDAPREKVFEVWTDAKRLAQWWGPYHFTCPVCEIDPRPGGAILIHMRGPDGTVHIMQGKYEEVVRPERIVFVNTVPDKTGKPFFEQRTIVSLEEEAEKTRLTVFVRVFHATPQAAPMLAGMEIGWTQTLDRLAQYLP